MKTAAIKTESLTYDFNVFVFVEQQILHLEITAEHTDSNSAISYRYKVENSQAAGLTDY